MAKGCDLKWDTHKLIGREHEDARRSQSLGTSAVPSPALATTTTTTTKHSREMNEWRLHACCCYYYYYYYYYVLQNVK
eukprot:scaffold160_cov139-Amphora_coffeaeformis.AAC.1